MTKYWELTYAIESQEVGVWDGFGQINLQAGFREKNQWLSNIFSPDIDADRHWWRKWAKMPDYGRDLNGLYLKKSGKLTDIMSFVGFMRGYIVNDKVRELLADYNLPRHKYFKAPIIKKDDIVEGYWWLVYDHEDGSNTVKFDESVFDLKWHHQNFKSQIEINTYSNYIGLFDESRSAAQSTKLVFNKNFDTELDLWGAQFLSLRSYISDRLLKAFQEHKINGYRVREPRCELIFPE